MKCFKAQEAEKAAKEKARNAQANAPRDVLKRGAAAVLNGRAVSPALPAPSKPEETPQFATVGEKDGISRYDSAEKKSFSHVLRL